MATVDDRFLFRRAIWSWHCKTLRRLRVVPPLLRFGVEVLLLLLVIGQVSCLVVLHSVLLPTAFSPHDTDPLALSLKSALWPEGLNSSELDANSTRSRASEFLVVEVVLPRCSDPSEKWNTCGSQVRCEFAAERALLDIPQQLRQSALTAAKHGLMTSVQVQAKDLGLHPKFLEVPLRSILARHILGSMIAGPLREEVLRREPLILIANASNQVSNETETNSDHSKAAQAALMEKWSLLAWGLAEFGGIGNASKVGSNALNHFSCEGQPSGSLHAMRRMAELLDRHMEWWLFKVVWAFSTGVFGLLAAVMFCYSVRTSLLGCFKLGMKIYHSSHSPGVPGGLDALEAIVLVLSPAGLAVVFCHMGDCQDTAALLLGLCLGEVASFCALQTKESRYLFPRVALPAYVADAYYSNFYPFGFTWLAHSSLLSFQAFVFLVLWSHLETTVPLPKFSLDQLQLEVKLRPSHSQDSKFQLSPTVQKLLLEQGLLLLGDNTSYETGVVMSAVISRAVQNMKVPCVIPIYPAGATELLCDHEELELVHPEALGGGAAVHMLLNRAFAGDARCAAMLVQLVSRMRSKKPFPSLKIPARLTLAQVGEGLRQRAGVKEEPEDE